MTYPSSSPDRGRGVRIVARAIVTTATAAAFVGMASVSASAVPGNTGSVEANVNVGSIITLSLDQGSFDLNLTPSSDVDKTGAVTGRVTTNNLTGYSIGVVAAAATLQPTRVGNTDNIPIADLEVHNVAGVYTPLSSNTANPVITTSKNTRSAVGATDEDPDGDTFSDDYQVSVGDINSDTYHVTLNYTATALA